MNKFNIRSTFDVLIHHIDQLCHELQHSEIIKANFYELPAVKKQDEEIAPKQIPILKLDGEDAKKKCINSFRDIFLSGRESGKLLQRFPGLLLVNDPRDTIKSRVAEVNLAKENFKNTILEISNNDARFEAVHNAVPDLITLAAYRKIHCESEPPFSVRFTWMKKHATRVLTKDAALQMLNRSSIYSNPRMIDQEKWKQLVEQEKYRVSSLSESAKLRIRRPTRVTPEVNVRYTASNRYHVSAALPFILLNPHPDTKIGELSNFIEKDDHPRKREYNFLVDRIYLERCD
ncbi:DNA replication terminus site-binding protein [Pseudoalteromonas sp. PS5]|uniref:DNA replication terminus site-binding protein n=1 Tax=Pseudoalteromonas sp. PS5 TaxID=1437473 RepID=UPI000FFF66B4|nr:DNA replication terminus site-binding protein [Pseudoalteromonas sp. PS5]RXF00238.1 DNA replication terminus site-binding protein [Pseudoalteromonas sp. PS5]